MTGRLGVVILATLCGTGAGVASLQAYTLQRSDLGSGYHQVAAESRWYSYEGAANGVRIHGHACLWRQGRLVGQLNAAGLVNRALLRPFKQALAKQARRMASFR